MGLITKKDVIRNMAALEEAPDDEEGREENEIFDTQEDRLLDEEEDERLRPSQDSP